MDDTAYARMKKTGKEKGVAGKASKDAGSSMKKTEIVKRLAVMEKGKRVAEKSLKDTRSSVKKTEKEK